MSMSTSSLPSYLLLVAINFGCTLPITYAGAKHCEGYMECMIFTGYTCKNNKCVCDPDQETGTYRCVPPRSYGDRCKTDQECQPWDPNLYCVKSDLRVCRCRRGYAWDSHSKKCFVIVEDEMYAGKFDPVRDLIIPGIIIMTIGAMVYLGVKLFCNCGKMCRRRRHQDITRELEEMSVTPHQQATWIASYRVFSPYNTATRGSSGLSPTSFPIHPTPCMGLFVPSQSLSTSPPTYEEALKHKVILSSYAQPPGPVAPPYTLPQPELPRQYQTLPALVSGPSLLSSSATGTLRHHGPRSYPEHEAAWYQGPGGEAAQGKDLWVPPPTTSSFRPPRVYTSDQSGTST